jgi:hypothetical protein
VESRNFFAVSVKRVAGIKVIRGFSVVLLKYLSNLILYHVSETFWICQKKSLTSSLPEPRRSYLRETKKSGPSTSTPINSYSRTDRLKRTNAVDIRSPEPNAKVKNWLDTVDPTITDSQDDKEVSTTGSANKFFRSKSSSPSTVLEEPPVQENVADPFEFHSSQNVKEVCFKWLIYALRTF